jgi:hypothetical protein
MNEETGWLELTGTEIGTWQCQIRKGADSK